MGRSVLSVKDLKVWFPIKKGLIKKTVGYVKAVDGVSFELRRGKLSGWSVNPVAVRLRWAKLLCGLIPSLKGRLS